MTTTVPTPPSTESRPERASVHFDTLADTLSATWRDHIDHVVVEIGNSVRVHLGPDRAFTLGKDLIDAALQADASLAGESDVR